MNADQVRAYVAAKWPEAMQSPLAKAFGAIIEKDEADRMVEEDRLERVAELRVIWAAQEHAAQCIDACEACGIDYDEDTLSHNIESNFCSLSNDACDAIAARAIANYRSAA